MYHVYVRFKPYDYLKGGGGEAEKIIPPKEQIKL